MSQKIMFLISLSLFAGVLFSTFLRAKEFLQTDGHNEIIVRPSNDQQSTGPRMPSSIRIEAYYDANLASVCAYLVNSSTWVKTTTWRKRCALVHHFRWPWNRTCRYMSNFEVVMVIGDSDSII